MTAVGNVRSRAVMNKLGMTHDPDDDFDHPRVPDGHSLKRHVLCRMTRERWHAAHIAHYG
jgi:RimJ/RimL family protein N-acetyltransferase